MRRKRALQQTSSEDLPIDYSESFFNLGEKDSTEFWNLENSVALAEVAIGKRVRTSGGIASYLDDLSSIEKFIVKVYSCSIKTQSAQRSKLLDTIFKDLENYNASNDIIDPKISQYLACCISCSSNFSPSTRSTLLKTLSKGHLLPTTKVISNIKGGLSLFVDWLKIFNGTSKNGSDHIIETVRELLKFQLNVARPTIEGALQSLIEQSTEFEMNYTSVLWRELWLNVSTTPSASCKKQALALLQYAITTRPHLVSCPKEIVDCLAKSASKSIDAAERSFKGVQETSYPGIKSAVHCAELFPLIVICYAEKDLIIITAALHLLVTSAHASISRWTLKLKSQAPTAVWNLVLQTIVECFRTVNRATASSKGPQYKILLALKQIVDCNPFGRQFDDKCTAKESLDIVRAELQELKSDQENIIAQGKRQSENAVEFLNQELSFLNTLQTDIHQSVLAVLVQGSIRGIAARNMIVIESIFQTTCCGVDPGAIMKHIEGFHKDISDKIRLVICNRSTHESGFLEIASSVLLCMESNLRIDSSQHILKSPAYQQLQQLSAIFVGGNPKPDVANLVQSLLKRLRYLLRANSSAADLSEGSTGHRLENFNVIVTTLISLSVLPMDCDGNAGQTVRQHLSSLFNYFQDAMVDLKKQILDKFADAAIYCTAWLLFFAQAKKMTFALSAPLNKVFESDLFSERSLKQLRTLIYPDLLSNPCVMPSAILFAMQLNDPQQLLFECIGHLQDCAFGGEETDIGSIVHYSNLIATVILENYKIVRDLARAKVYSSTDQSFDGFRNEGIKEPSAISATSAMNPDVASSHSIVADTEPNEDDAIMVDYMDAANLQEHVNQVEIDDLEKSVSAKDSFLACFLPLFTKLISADELPEVVRLGALRTLSAYMKCSRYIFIAHVQLLEELIVQCPLDIFGNRLNHLRIESTLVWMENFTLTPLTLAIPVRTFLDYLEAIGISTTVDVNHRSGVNSVMTVSDVNKMADQKFMIILLNCMHSLLKERKLRDEAECAVAIGLPLAFRSSERIEILQEESIKILKDVFVNYPYLFTRTLYQLCIPLQSNKMMVLDQSVSNLVSDLVEERLDQSAKLLLIKTIIQIAQNEEELKSKVDDADRALTDEVIRCNNAFALAALLFLKMTTESANAIKDAEELGILNTLDPAISKQLRKRVGLRCPLPVDLNDT